MKKSIRSKLYTVFIGLLLFFLLGIFIITNLLLDDIIIYANKRIISSVYEEHDEQFKVYSINEQTINKITNQNNIGLVIFEDDEITNCTASFICYDEEQDMPEYVSRFFKHVPEGQINHYFINYKLLNVNELIYIYNVDGERYVLITKSLDTIHDINNIIRPFIALTSLFSLILGSIAIYIVSRKITSPITKITEYANQIANQRFDQLISINTDDELQLLAENMNKINVQLSQALNSLKSDLQKEKELDKKRVKFFSSISHELKTPITIIQGYADGLKHNIVKDEKSIKEYSDIIINESKKMNRLISDLLNLSLLESDQFKLSKEKVNIIRLVKEVSVRYLEAIKERDIDVTIDHPNCKVVIEADPYRLEQVILNLVNNAVKHLNDEGKIKIKIEIQDNEVIVKVYNSGELIEENELTQIWDLFYKADSNKNQIGTGLGLAIVKSIITLHQGKYGVVNKDLGVEFFFTIPIQD